MTDRNRRRTNRNVWLSIGVAVLIILLIAWIIIAGYFGDTDVAAMIPPLAEHPALGLLPL